ncbi:hypothetical protein BI364_10500 [Acidihalobacter yilgarnensis]|uniref:Uncharacterized protein n=1 Tax=Acidihalobacter yilgarnensis TaxID=2819280 RepID=A0A1D8IPD7_9GAMM|nr:hypothetical protein BI364_10500 [Acidihalobacter yilgarnensis]
MIVEIAEPPFVSDTLDKSKLGFWDEPIAGLELPVKLNVTELRVPLLVTVPADDPVTVMGVPPSMEYFNMGVACDTAGKPTNTAAASVAASVAFFMQMDSERISNS